MATYRQISDSEVAVDAPLTQQLMQAYKDNLTSVIEDDASAPSIKRSAISDAVSDQKLAVAGNVSIGAEEILKVGVSTQDTNSPKFIVAVSGKYNIVACAFKLNSQYSGSLRAVVYVNNTVATQTGNLGSTNFTSSVASDYQLNAGDEVYVQFDEINPISGLADAQVRAFLGVSVETAAFYNRIGGRDISDVSVNDAPSPN